MSIRRRMVLLVMVMLLAGGYAIGNDLVNSFSKAHSEMAENMMYEFAKALASQVESAGGVEAGRAQLEMLFANYREKPGETSPNSALNIYVTDASGIVVFSSKDPSEVGKNYGRWNDVYHALRGRYGARSTRLNPADPGSSVYFVAAPIQLGGKISGVVSVIKSEESVTPFLYRALQRALPVLVLTIALLALFSALIMIWITTPIHKLRDYALAVSEGKPGKRPAAGPKELRELLDAFEKMRISLEGKKTIENFVQGLVHELKSPLTAIQGSAELSLEDVPSEQRSRFLHNILREGHRLQSLLEELLRLAKLENRVGLERKEKVSVSSLAEDACLALESVATQRGLKLERSANGSSFVLGDSLLLEQAVRNLIGNAMDFSPEGETIRVSVAQESGGVSLTVSDRGPGVPEFARERIFEKFYSLERPGGGAKSSGLGLNFVREVCLMHGGSVELLPSAGGASFRIQLPSFS